MIRGSVIVTAFVGEQTAAGISFSCQKPALPSVCSISDTQRIKSGVVPQQPPNTLMPYLRRFFIICANSSGDTLYSLVTGSGSPAFGFTIIGRFVHSESFATTGSNSAGPNEQLTPSASTPSPLRVSAMDSIQQPVKVLWLISKVIVTATGKSECSFAASTAALHSSKSVMVSKTTRSAPAALPASTISRYIS